MNKIQVETPLVTRTLKIGDIVQASPELILLTMLGHGFKLRIISIVNEYQVVAEVLEHNSFTKTHEQALTVLNNTTTTSATVNYKKNEIKRFQFKIAAKYLEPVKTKHPSSISGFGF